MVEGTDAKIPHPDDKTPQSECEKKDQQPSESIKPAREPRVARTMLDISVLQKKRKVAKTLLEQNNPAATLQEAPVTELALSSPKPNQDVSGRYVARTMIDRSMLFQAVSQSQVKMEQKAAEVAKERAKEPVETITPIVADGKTSKCQWSWAEPFNGKERYRACTVCQAGVYDFEGLERAQAEAIVFKRENLKKPKFYERSDGKFMTRDCPKQVARKMQLITWSALAIVSIASVIIAIMLMPPAPKVDRTATPLQPEKSEINKQATSAPGEAPTATPSAARGMFIYENGKVISRPSVRNSQKPSTTAPLNSTAPDQQDQMWQTR